MRRGAPSLCSGRGKQKKQYESNVFMNLIGSARARLKME